MVVKVQGILSKMGPMDTAVEVIRNQMSIQGLTPTTLAKKAGVGYPYLYRVLKHEQTPTIEWLEKVLGSLGISMEMHFETKK